MSLIADYLDLFIDPISHRRMTDPVIIACGHSFERDQINGWVSGGVPTCPLCKEPVRNLIENMFIRQALQVLDNPDNRLKERVEEFNDEAQESIKAAVDAIRQLRTRDAARGVPDRVPVATFFDSVKKFYAPVCKC